MTKLEAIKTFMSVPGKPVTSRELIDLRKADPEGYDWIANECLKALGEKE